MPTVRVREVCEKPWREVFQWVGDFERYPERVPDLVSVHIVERGEGWTVSAWEARLGGSRVRWTERDEWTEGEAGGRIAYRQLHGDLKRFAGYWDVCSEGTDRTAVEFFCDFEIGLPGLAAMLHPVAQWKLGQSMAKLLRALQSRTEVGDRGVPVRVFDPSP